MNADTDETSLLALDDLQKAISAIPYAQMMGISLRWNDGILLGHLAYAEHLIGNPTIPALHGGVPAALLQITAMSQVMMVTKSDRMPQMFSCNVEYLRWAKPIDTFAVATVVSLSRRFANVRVSGYQEHTDQVIAAASIQCLLVDRT